MRCSTYTSRLALSLQVKNILYHCVKEAASSLKKSGSEKDDEEHNSWCPLSLAFHRWLWLHQHLALSTPSSFCHGGLCHVTTINGWLKAGHVIQRTSQCDPHSCHTSSGQWEALPPLSSPQTFSAKRSQIEEQLGWEGWKPHRLQTQSECWLGASLEPVWWSESALQTSKLVKCRFHGSSDCPVAALVQPRSLLWMIKARNFNLWQQLTQLMASASPAALGSKLASLMFRKAKRHTRAENANQKSQMFSSVASAAPSFVPSCRFSSFF